MDFIKVYERIRERGMEAEWGTLNNGLPQISVRVLPVPGPAETATAGSVALTASHWASFKP